MGADAAKNKYLSIRNQTIPNIIEYRDGRSKHRTIPATTIVKAISPTERKRKTSTENLGHTKLHYMWTQTAQTLGHNEEHEHLFFQPQQTIATPVNIFIHIASNTYRIVKYNRCQHVCKNNTCAVGCEFREGHALFRLMGGKGSTLFLEIVDMEAAFSTGQKEYLLFLRSCEEGGVLFVSFPEKVNPFLRFARKGAGVYSRTLFVDFQEKGLHLRFVAWQREGG
jgi:hypothetical protein